MKKRQQDFQKVKLKVGKRLPKGRNETRTSFQSKKINLLKQQIREATDKQTLKELLSFMKSPDVKLKITTLQKLFVYVSQNQDNLSMFFPDILKELGKALQESDPKIRSETISVLGLCSEILSDIQFKTFVDHLTSYLNCVMTHVNFGVQQDSLKFLDVLLNSHCSVICRSHEILSYLLNMISCKDGSGKKGSKNKDGRKLVDKVSSKITADDWRMLVLERMLTFLKGILSKKNSTAMETDDKKEIYWDAKEALYLPLYLNSGVEPAKFDYSQYCSVKSEDCDSKNFKKFINELICILPAILKSFPTNKSLSEANIKCLGIVTQILCCLGEWTIQNVDLDYEWNPVQSLIYIYNQLEKSFPYSQQAGKSANSDEVDCVQINLGICYFYCMCNLLTENPEKLDVDAWDVVKLYLANVFSNSGMNMSEKSISLTLKISKIVMQCKSFNESDKNGILLALLGTLDTNQLSPIANDIYSFFIDVSLNYDYNYLHKTQAMRAWFQSLLGNLSFMMESKLFADNYLNYMKQVCVRKYFPFMETLNKFPSEKLIKLLKFDDEDFQRTIIHLILSLDKISPEFLQDLGETIRNESFSLKTASRLIRLLHSRFIKSDVPDESDVPPLDQMNFVKFLLNLACDTFLIMDPSLDTEPLPLTEMLINSQKSFACRYLIYPTSDFKRHQEIFEVCAECLLPFFKNEINRNCARYFIRAIFTEHDVRYPVHSLIAFLELFRRFPFLQPHGVAYEIFQNFIYSCLLYNCVIVNDVPIEHWTEYCVPAVQDCLDTTDANIIVDIMMKCIPIFENDQVLHVLRILRFLMQRQLLDVVDKDNLYIFLEKLREPAESSKQNQFKNLMHIFYEYLRSFE